MSRNNYLTFIRGTKSFLACMIYFLNRNKIPESRVPIQSKVPTAGIYPVDKFSTNDHNCDINNSAYLLNTCNTEESLSVRIKLPLTVPTGATCAGPSLWGFRKSRYYTWQAEERLKWTVRVRSREREKDRETEREGEREISFCWEEAKQNLETP